MKCLDLTSRKKTIKKEKDEYRLNVRRNLGSENFEMYNEKVPYEDGFNVRRKLTNEILEMDKENYDPTAYYNESDSEDESSRALFPGTDKSV